MKKLRVFCFFVVSIICCAAASGQAAPAAERPDDHAALRALLEKSAQALNTRNFDAIAPHLHGDFTMITADNQKFVGLEAFKKYYANLFEGPDAKLTKFETKLVADEVTRFLGPNAGVVYGTSEDTYHFKDGAVRTMRTRWSAVTEKDAGGWKVVNAHFSVNVLDNPVVDIVKATGVKMAAVAGIVGLLLGAFVMFLLRGRRA